MLLSDGGILKTGLMNFDQFTELIQANSKKSKLHTIGVGCSISRNDKLYLVKSAKTGGGNSIFIAETEDISNKIVKLLEETLYPCLTNISLKYDENLVIYYLINLNKMLIILSPNLKPFIVY